MVSAVRKVPVSRGLWCLIVVIAGCSRSSGPELATVTGVVTLAGKPLPGAKVVFQPRSSEVRVPSTGTTDESGHFELTFNREHKGAVTGTHVVRITTRAVVSDESGKESEVPEVVPDKYNNNSELEFQVKNGVNEFEIPLEAAPARR